MAYWLFKQEPEEFSYDDLQAAGKTTWDGVSNALAQKHMRSLKAGDKVLLYHTGKEKAIVGVMEIASDPQVAESNDKQVTVEVIPLRKFANPVTLTQIKEDDSFSEWELVRISRLSVMPVSVEHWKKIEAMSKSKKSKPKQ